MSRGSSACMRPVFVADKSKGYKNDLIGRMRKEYKEVNLVPCGKCPNCLKRRASAWSVRLMQEEKVSKSAYFITLTYNSDSVPITRNGYLSICKEHLQKWLKRVRYRHGEGHWPLKYYAVGEYGGNLKRPHYHVILFNADLKLLFDKSQRLVLDAYGMDGKVCVNSLDWHDGHVTVGCVTGASVGYTLKYISKPYKNFQLNDDRVKPFSLMSKGLGLSYLENPENWMWHHADLENRMYMNVDGKKCTMPRYYKERLYSDEERKRISKSMERGFVMEIYRELVMLSSDQIERDLRDRRINKDEAIQKFNSEIKNKNYGTKIYSAVKGGKSLGNRSDRWWSAKRRDIERSVGTVAVCKKSVE